MHMSGEHEEALMDPTCLGGVRSTAQARSEGIFRLVMLWSPVEADFGQMHVLQNRSLVLGRTRGDCTLTLDDPRLAPVQAVLEPGPNGQSWRLRLSGGGHETFVNGRRVEHTELRAGDVILQLGRYRVATLRDLSALLRLLPAETGRVRIGVLRGDRVGYGILEW